MDHVGIFCMQHGQGLFSPVITGIFILIHNDASFLHHLKNHKYFQCFYSLLLDKNHKHNYRAKLFFRNQHRRLEQSVLHWHLIILRADWGAASKSVNTGMNLFDFTVQPQSTALRNLEIFSETLVLCSWFGSGNVSGLKNRCSYFINTLFMAPRTESLVGISLENNRYWFVSSWFFLFMWWTGR